MIAGFRIERLLGEGEMGPVYEAVQLSLDRRVALRLLAGGHPVSASVDHPNIVPIYEAGEWEGHSFAISRLVRGESLAELLDAGSLSPGRFDELMEAVTDAVAAAHRAGLAHGGLVAHNVIVDRAGNPFIADFGLGRPGTVEGDLDALAALSSRRPKRARRPAKLVAGGGACLLAVAGLLLVAGRDGADTGAAKPISSTGCAPDPDLNTPACTIGQDVLGGQRAQVRKDGVVRRWAVRGAAGDLSLQVLRLQGGRTVRVGFSQPARVRSSGSRAFPANLNVKRGDRIGVLLGPGARIGLRSRPGATARLWDGNRTPLPPDSIALAGELLLRADVSPGARAVAPRQLTGEGAAAAPPGRVLARADVELVSSASIEARLVRVGRSIAIDSFRGPRRLARIAVPDADVRGRVLELTGTCEYPNAICLQWRNRGDAFPLIHAYSFARGGRRFRVIG